MTNSKGYNKYPPETWPSTRSGCWRLFLLMMLGAIFWGIIIAAIWKLL